MRSLDGIVLTFLANAVWQIPVLLAAGALGERLLRRGPARIRHALWIGVLAASVLLPAASLLPRQPVPRDDAPAALLGEAPAVHPSPLPHPAADPARLPGGLVRCVALLYGLSLAAHAIRLARAWRRTGRLAHEARPAAVPPQAAVIAGRCREAFGLRPVPLLCSGAVDGPVTLGVRRPAILLPPAFLESTAPDPLTAALGHEMAHIHRRDFLVHLLAEIWLLPVAFHPATGWLRRRLAESREMACDEATVERLIAPRVYARSLLSMASTLAGSSRPAYTLGALGADLLEVRMRRLLDAGPRLSTRRARVTLGLAALLLAAASLAAAGLSFDARAATGDLSPFVGTWKNEFSELVIRESGGNPEVALTVFRRRPREDGSIATEPIRSRVLDPRVTGRTLRFRTQAEIQYRPDGPREKVELDQVFELLGDGQARLRQVWSSLEGRKDVPPPGPPMILKRQS